MWENDEWLILSWEEEDKSGVHRTLELERYRLFLR